MKIQLLLVAMLASMTTSCATTFEETIAYPPQYLESWNREFIDLRGGGHILEAVPPGQTVKNWTEIFTIQLFRGNADSLDAAFASMRERIQSVCPDVVMKRVSEDEHSVTYEFWTQGNTSFKAQHELGRFFLGESGLHRVAYARKGAPLPSMDRAKWLDVINRCSVFDVDNGKALHSPEEVDLERLHIPVIEKPRTLF